MRPPLVRIRVSASTRIEPELPLFRRCAELVMAAGGSAPVAPDLDLVGLYDDRATIPFPEGVGGDLSVTALKDEAIGDNRHAPALPVEPSAVCDAIPVSLEVLPLPETKMRPASTKIGRHRRPPARY